MKKPDPQYLIIDLYQGEARDEGRALKDFPIKNPTRIKISASQETVLPAINAAIKHHIETYGTVKELRFAGHGGPWHEGGPPRMGAAFEDGLEGELDASFTPGAMRAALERLKKALNIVITEKGRYDEPPLTKTIREMQTELDSPGPFQGRSADVLVLGLAILRNTLQNVPNPVIAEALKTMKAELVPHILDAYFSNECSMPDLLDSLSETQRTLGKPIADRMVFTGCSLMESPRDPIVQNYQQFAMKNKTSLVLSTTDTEFDLRNNFKGRFVEITPQGNFHRDRLDSMKSQVDGWSDYLTKEHPEISADEIPQFSVEGSSARSENRYFVLAVPQNNIIR